MRAAIATVTCYGFPARGHTVPSLALIRGLVGRGVEVQYHSTTAFRHLVEGAGAQFVEYPAAVERLSRVSDLAEHLLSVVEVTAAILPDLLATSAPAPDLVLFDASALWGRIVARRLEVPAVSSITTFAMNRSMLQLLAARDPGTQGRWASSEPAIAALNARYGASLRDPIDVIASAGNLRIVHTSRDFQPAGSFLDSSHIFVGPGVGARPAEGTHVSAEGLRPLAYLSLGTIFNRDVTLLRDIAGILSEAGWQVVVALGGAERDDPGGWAPHVRAYPFVDQASVLAGAALMVTHGGMNSVAEGLANRVPMIVIPQAVDQHLVARRAADLGAAIVVEPEEPLREALGAALERIERDRDSFVAAAKKIALSFSRATPVEAAVERMLELAKNRSSSLVS